MKICVYSIAKNEEEFVERWSKSSLDADLRVVLDTGSSDRTMELLKKENIVCAQQIIGPWRFDVARNASLYMIPDDVDVCISMDMDEVLCDNWRKYLEEAWTDHTTMLRYPFHSQPRSSYGFKVHSRHDYYWKYAVHEILVAKRKHFESWSEEFQMSHLPKNVSGSYLDSLLFWNKKEPQELHYIFYIAREYFDKGNYLFSLKYLEDYVNSNVPKDPNEESFVHRMISWCLRYTKSDYNDVIRHLFYALGLAPNSREVWGHLAEEMLTIKNYPNAFSSVVNALKVKTNENVYMVEHGWEEKMAKILFESSKALGISEEKVKELFVEHIEKPQPQATEYLSYVNYETNKSV